MQPDIASKTPYSITLEEIDELEGISAIISAARETLEEVRTQTERDGAPWDDVFFIASHTLGQAVNDLRRWIERKGR